MERAIIFAKDASIPLDDGRKRNGSVWCWADVNVVGDCLIQILDIWRITLFGAPGNIHFERDNDGKFVSSILRDNGKYVPGTEPNNENIIIEILSILNELDSQSCAPRPFVGMNKIHEMLDAKGFRITLLNSGPSHYLFPDSIVGIPETL